MIFVGMSPAALSTRRDAPQAHRLVYRLLGASPSSSNLCSELSQKGSGSWGGVEAQSLCW